MARKPQIRWKEYEAPLKELYLSHSATEISEIFAKRFKLEVSPGAISQKLYALGVRKQPRATQKTAGA